MRPGAGRRWSASCREISSWRTTLRRLPSRASHWACPTSKVPAFSLTTRRYLGRTDRRGTLSGKDSWQSEARHHADVEAGQLGDAVPRDDHDDKTGRAPGAGRRVVGVDPAGRAAVGAGVDQPEPAA